MNLILEFELPGLPKTVNQVGRKSWQVKAKEAKKWKFASAAHCIALGAQGKRLEKAHLELTRYSSRETDVDNMVSSWKHVIDGLVLAEVIIDDKPSVIGSPIFNWVKVPRKDVRIQIKVFEVSDPQVVPGTEL